MKKASAYRAAVTVAVIVSCFVAAVPEDSAAWSVYTGSQYYNVAYQDSSQYTYVTKVQAYLKPAFEAAYNTLGKRGYQGKIAVFFYYENSSTMGFTPLGENKIYLNTKYLTSETGAQIGATVAHETSHVLFNAYTHGSTWNTGNMAYLRTFLTESLAFYTGDSVYTYGNGYNAGQIKYYLNYYRAATGIFLSWYNTGYCYRIWNNLTANGQRLVYWQLMAQGWYLHTGLGLFAGTNGLGNTLYALQYSASQSGKMMRSSDFDTARSWFEASFKYGYGYAANSMWQYAKYYSTTYLYGKWWYIFFT